MNLCIAFISLLQLVYCAVGLDTSGQCVSGLPGSCGSAAADESSLLQSKLQMDPKPFEIAPCDPFEDGAHCPAGSCGDVKAYPCEAKGWVFCQNAVCEEPTVDPASNKLVANCHCWQPQNTNFSLLPVISNSGANCVMDTGPGGEAMCEEMQNGKLVSTYGPTGDFLPGKPLRSANCPPGTRWAWCWGAPCKREENGNITCACPMMVSTNSANQSLSLVPDQCPGKQGSHIDPCTEGVKNSMPAGSSPATFLPSSSSSECYSY